MTLVDKIAQLERKLALKKAYLDVAFTFSKEEMKFYPQDVRDEVIKNLSDTAEKLADDQEPQFSGSTDSLFTEQEVTILKQMVDTVLSKKQVLPQTLAPKSDSKNNEKFKFVSTTENNTSQSKVTADKAQILMMDNIDKTLRNKIEPQAIVKVLETREENAFVQDPKGIRFWIPLDDIDFNYTTGA